MVAHQYCGSRTPVPVCNVSVSQQTGSTSNSVHVSVTQLAFRGQELLESSRPTAQKHLQFRCYCSHTPVHVYTASVLQLAVSAEHDVLQFATHILQLAVSAEHDVLQFATHILQLAVNAEHDVLQFATQLAVSAEHDVLQIATHILQLAVNAEHDVLQFATRLAVSAERDVLQIATHNLQLAVSAEHDVLQIATHILQLVSVLQVFLSRQEILEHQ